MAGWTLITLLNESDGVLGGIINPSSRYDHDSTTVASTDPPHMPTPTPPPTFSFIIPAWNEAKVIAATVTSIATAADHCQLHHEIIVVDDSSTDGTGEIAVAAGATVVTVAHRQIAATRNSGAAAASGNVLVFVDGDTTVTPRLLAAMAEAAGSGVTYGGCRVEFDGNHGWIARQFLNWTQWILAVMKIVPGCFIYVQREAFDAVGGFNERYFAAEEWVLCRALRRQGRFRRLAESVTTSGRKLQTCSPVEIIWQFAKIFLTFSWATRHRDQLAMWYSPESREDQST